MWIRIKRSKTTYFASTVLPTDSVKTLKEHTASIFKKQPNEIKLLLKTNTNDYVTLDDTGILEQIGIVNDSVVYLVFWIKNEANAAAGHWETVAVPEYESAEADIIEEVEKRKEIAV